MLRLKSYAAFDPSATLGTQAPRRRHPRVHLACGRGDGADGSGGVVSARNSLIARSFRRKRGSGTGCPPLRQNKSLLEALDVLRFNELNRKSVSEVTYHAADHFSDGKRRPDLGYDIGGNGRPRRRHVDDEA